jgi:hypothetical protein
MSCYMYYRTQQNSWRMQAIQRVGASALQAGFDTAAMEAILLVPPGHETLCGAVWRACGVSSEMPANPHIWLPYVMTAIQVSSL